MTQKTFTIQRIRKQGGTRLVTIPVKDKNFSAGDFVLIEKIDPNRVYNSYKQDDFEKAQKLNEEGIF